VFFVLLAGMTIMPSDQPLFRSNPVANAAQGFSFSFFPPLIIAIKL
jgi:hypothetical protein